MTRHTKSLATRLFLSATAWVVLILVITGIVLSTVYKRSTERAFDRRLNFYLRTLIAEVAQPDDPSDKSDKSDKSDRSVQSLGEPLFELPLSGWYWRLARIDGLRWRGKLERDAREGAVREDHGRRFAREPRP